MPEILGKNSNDYGLLKVLDQFLVTLSDDKAMKDGNVGLHYICVFGTLIAISSQSNLTIMKKATLLLLLFSALANAQAYPRLYNDQEMKFNIGLFLATTTLDFSYEYFLGEDTSLGGTIYFDSDPLDYNGNFGIGPNFRAYFGFQPRSGFFAEAFGLYYTGEDDSEISVTGRKQDYSSLALGLGLGNKWVTRSQRFSLEVFGGFGRNINPEDFQETFMYRGGLAIGFRF